MPAQTSFASVMDYFQKDLCSSTLRVNPPLFIPFALWKMWNNLLTGQDNHSNDELAQQNDWIIKQAKPVQADTTLALRAISSWLVL